MRSTLIRPLAAASVFMLSAMAAVAGAPAASAGAGAGSPADCNLHAVSKGKGGDLVCQDAKSARFHPDFPVPVTPTSSAWLSHPYYVKKELYGVGGQLVIDGKGRAAWVQGVDDSYWWAKPVKTNVTGLRLLASAASTGDPDVRPVSDTFLYAVTTAGALVQVPVSWTKAGLPALGKPKTLARGFGQYADLDFAWWRGQNWKPTEDSLLGLTKDGRLIEITVTRGATPKITSRAITSTGMKNTVDLTTEGGGWGEKATAWIIRSADGTTRRYVDPVYSDHSFKGVKVMPLPKIPTSIALL